MYPLRYKVFTSALLFATAVILLYLVFLGFTPQGKNPAFLYQWMPSVFTLSLLALIASPVALGSSGHWLALSLVAPLIALLSLGTGRYIYNLQFILLLGVCINVHLFYKKEIRILENKVTATEKIKEATNILKAQRQKAEKINAALSLRFERYSSLREIGEIFSAKLSLDEVYQTAVDTAYNLIPRSDSALVLIVDEAKERLELVASRTGTELPRIKSKHGDIFDQWVFKERHPLSVLNIDDDFRFDYKPPADERHFLSLISVPLISQSRILGIMRLNSREKDVYTFDDLRLLDFISDLVSSAVNNARLYKTTEELSITDSLTGLYNHRYLQVRLEEEVNRVCLTGSALSIVMIDIDHFKDYNDRYGHVSGDKILIGISNIAKGLTKKSDIVARYGGEEFAIILPNVGQDEAVALTERIRQEVSSAKFMLRRKETSVTISAGVGSYSDNIGREDLLKRADFSLYKAKKEGRNRVCWG